MARELNNSEAAKLTEALMALDGVAHLLEQAPRFSIRCDKMIEAVNQANREGQKVLSEVYGQQAAASARMAVKATSSVPAGMTTSHSFDANDLERLGDLEKIAPGGENRQVEGADAQAQAENALQHAGQEPRVVEETMHETVTAKDSLR